MRRESIHIQVDDAVIAAGDMQKVFDSFWWTVDIDNGEEAYENSLRPFSRGQRLLHAFQWYLSEVLNGGHEQFFSNSSGIVWKNALEACKAMGMNDRAAILQEAIERFGEEPSMDQFQRGDTIEENEIDFGDLDTRFYELPNDEKLGEAMLAFVRAHRNEFYFDGVVEKSVP